MRIRVVPWLVLVTGLLLAGAAGRALWLSWHHMRLMAMEVAPPPPGMVLVPAGWFLKGSDDPEANPDERPLRRCFLPAYYIDRHEVTHREYRAFRKDQAFPEQDADRPVTGLLKSEAEAYARFVGKRLPTAAEWEKAARGTDGRRYPWGDEYETGRANVRPENVTWVDGVLCARVVEAKAGTNLVLLQVEPVGSYPAGASPCGAEDMSGNVWEWVADEWRDANALGFRTGFPRGILRGGGYAYSPRHARTSYQAFESLESTCNDVGFRCARDAAPLRARE